MTAERPNSTIYTTSITGQDGKTRVIHNRVTEGDMHSEPVKYDEVTGQEIKSEQTTGQVEPAEPEKETE